MKLALAQMRMSADMDENCRRSVRAIERAAGKGADLVLFPEIQLAPFFPQYEDRDAGGYALKPDSPYIRELCAAAARNHIYLSPNIYLEEHGKRYDMSLLVDDSGAVIGRQKMVHIAQCEQFYEQSYYTPSEEGFAVFDTKFGAIGIVVCFDRHYPESIRTEALRGAQLILIPTANTRAEPSDLFEWEVRVQAFENSVNVAMCNRTGTEDEMEFSGESLVCDFNGNALARAGNGEKLLIADVDLPEASRVRTRKPYTSLLRPELYGL